MLKKIRDLTHQHAIPAALIFFAVFDLFLLGLGQLLSLLPEALPYQYLCEAILVLLPITCVFLFGFSSTFRKGSLLRGLLYGLPFIAFQLISLLVFLAGNLENPELNWKPWPLIVYGLISILGVGIREECIYRATIQNIIAKKHANSVKGIWITVIIAALIFGLTHASNLLFGMDPIAVLTQMISAFAIGLLFGAIYLRSGSIWAAILIHTLTDVSGLAASTFLYVGDLENMNQLSWRWEKLIVWLVYIAFTAFLLRPSKCKQITESFCFAGEASETAERA